MTYDSHWNSKLCRKHNTSDSLSSCLVTAVDYIISGCSLLSIITFLNSICAVTCKQSPILYLNDCVIVGQFPILLYYCTRYDCARVILSSLLAPHSLQKWCTAALHHVIVLYNIPELIQSNIHVHYRSMPMCPNGTSINGKGRKGTLRPVGTPSVHIRSDAFFYSFISLFIYRCTKAIISETPSS